MKTLILKCLDCECVGFVRIIKNEGVLVPSKEKKVQNYRQTKKFALKKQ